MRTTLLLCALLAIPVLATPGAAQVSAVEGELMRADREFARATRERGLEGWMSFYAEDAVRLRWRDPSPRGLEAIRAFDARLFEDPGLVLTWEPNEAGVYRDGLHGWTRGRSEIRRRDGTPVPGTQGSYLTLWRREPSGEWKVILDTGTPDAPPAPPRD